MQLRSSLGEGLTGRQLFAFNILSALLIAAVFGIGVVLAAVSARTNVLSAAETATRQWVAAAVAPAVGVRRLLVGSPLDNAEAARLRWALNSSDIVAFELMSLDGAVLFAFGARAPASERTGPDDWSALRGDVIVGNAVVDVRHEGLAAAEVYADAFVPILEDGAVTGVARVLTDQTSVYNLHAGEMINSILLISALAVIGLVNTAATAWMLRNQHRSNVRIRHLAHHDPLTGVANRTRFQILLERSLKGSRAADGWVALHMLDLDGFKTVNDSLGHDAGDALLRVVAERITACIRTGDVFARLGGDEFGVVQRHVHSLEQAERFADRMVDATRTIRDVNGMPVSVTLSVGIAMSPQHAGDPCDLQKCADAALYRAKGQGRDQAVMFQPGMGDDFRNRNTLRVMIRSALETGAFELHYQPLHDAADGALTGFEALLRLPDGEGGLIAPSIFIPIAEDMGLTPRIGTWVLDEACRIAAAWPTELCISVNLSPQQFNEDLQGIVEHALAASGIAPERLELEITESLFIAEPNAVEAKLHRLKALGVRIVMDDFGTGYSSLSYLWKFPFDKLKVDRSCFLSLSESENVGEVLRAISAMSGAMKLRVVAEGIETEAQRTFALESGYDELQGFLYGRPMPAMDVTAYIDGRGNRAPDDIVTGPAPSSDDPVRVLH